MLPHNYHHPAALHRTDYIDEPLYALVPVFNPVRYRTRWKHYLDCEHHLLCLGFHVVTIECSFGERQEVLSKSKSDKHTVIHVHTENELWLKENLLNLALQRLPKTAKYFCTIDGDIAFTRNDIVGETLHKLQHHHVVQMFSVALDMTPNFVPYQVNYGFVHDYLNGVPDKLKPTGDGSYYEPVYTGANGTKSVLFHPGFCWAYTIEAINHLGGLIDWAILGSADQHMARALIGQYEKSCHKDISPEYKGMLKIWQDRATDFIKRDIGYVEGTINHFFHGAKVNRRYKDRWKILVEHNFQPSLDLKRMYNGTWQLTDRVTALRDDIRDYFKLRDEDNTDLKGHPGFIPGTR